MHTWPDYVQFLITLLVIVDPFFTAPLFLGLTGTYTHDERNRTARRIGITVFVVLSVSALTGETLLRVLGTTFGAFQVGGGLVLLLMALTMLQFSGFQSLEAAVQSDSEDPSGISGVVPLGIPLLAGPGSISTVVIASHDIQEWHEFLPILAGVGIVAATVWGTFRLAGRLVEYLGTVTLRIANRLLGLILAAIAVQYIADGLKRLFPILAGSA